jgi:hypothetical protein
MKNCHVEINGDQILIRARKGPIGIRLFLWAILVINLLAPIAGGIFYLSQGDGPHIGLFISIGLTWLIGYLLLRIILWNSFGKEVISLLDNAISYRADYKWFSGSHKTIKTYNDMDVISNTWEAIDGYERLYIQSEEDSIMSVLDIKKEDLNLIREKIKTRYNKA